ncbi:MAG: hypothetical protein AAGD07_09205 [Planctomycetota bacterium]
MISTATPEKRFNFPANSESNAGHAPDLNAAGFDATEILHTVRRRGVLGVLLAGPIAIAVAIAVFIALPEEYRSSALLRLSATETSLVFDGEDGTDFEVFQGTQKELVRTRLVMTAALRNERMANSSVLLEDQPVAWMLKNVTVSTPPKTEVMSVSTVATAEADPVSIVNATVDAYLVEVVNRERATRQAKLVGIEEVLEEKQLESRRMRNELKRLVDELGTGDAETLAVTQQMLVQEMGLVRRELINLKSRKLTYQGRLAALRAAQEEDADDDRDELDASETAEDGNGAPSSTNQETVGTNDVLLSEADIDTALAADRIYSELIRDKINTFRAQAEAEAAFKGDAKSPYGDVQKEIDRAIAERREQIIEEARAMAPIRQRAREGLRRNEIESQIAGLIAELPAIDEMIRQLSVQEQTLVERFRTVGNNSIDVEMMRSEIEQLDQVIDSIAQQREVLKVELQSRARVELLRPATDLEPASSAQRAGLAGAAGLMSFFLPFGLMLGWDLSQQRVGSAGRLADKSGIAVIGTLPMIPPRALKQFGKRESGRVQAWRSKLHEAAKRISATVYLGVEKRDDECLVLMVTSAVRGEGKSTLAAQLARGLATRSRSVVLCDFDLRRPRLHSMLGLSNEAGVSELLQTTGELDATLQSTEIEGLRALTAGDGNTEAISALVDGNAGPLFSELRGIADVIVVDSPPVLTSADVGFLSPHVDQILFAARRDLTRLPELKRGLDAIPAWEHQIAGTVMIDKCDDAVDKSFA